METQKRKQNEKEKAERRMKIVAGLGSIDEYIPYVLAGADELFCGYVPYNWTKKYGTVLPLNRREVLAYNVHLGSFGELEILSAMIRKYRKPVHIAMNSLYYIPEQYEEIAGLEEKGVKLEKLTGIVHLHLKYFQIIRHIQISMIILHTLCSI